MGARTHRPPQGPRRDARRHRARPRGGAARARGSLCGGLRRPVGAARGGGSGAERFRRAARGRARGGVLSADDRGLSVDIRVQQESFDLGAEANAFAARQAGMGAVVTFTGIVRDLEGGLDAMEIEHYPGMTESALTGIAEEAARRWQIGDALILHRYGRLTADELIMMVATASRHRADAFQAAEFLMDYLKSRAPFWKKEVTRARRLGRRPRRGRGRPQPLVTPLAIARARGQCRPRSGSIDRESGMTDNRRTGGQLLVACLEALGARHSFGVPGESYLAVLDALHDTAGRLDFTLCRQEGGAAFMAAAYGKLTGSPGICWVTRGPGATNAAIGVHTAMQDSTPMILFVGQIETGMREREAFQEIDHRAFFGPIAKWATEIDSPDRVPEIVARAWHTALSGRPGPVVVALPEDMLIAESDARPHTAPIRPPWPGVDRDAVRDAHAMIARSERPVALIGGGGW